MEHTLPLAAAPWQRSRPAPDAVVRLPLRTTLARDLAAGTCIAVQAGRIWLTQTGDVNDYFVDAGQRHVVARAGRVVIEGLSVLAMLHVGAGAPAARPGFP